MELALSMVTLGVSSSVAQRQHEVDDSRSLKKGELKTLMPLKDGDVQKP
jgi:hypothetical protein